MKLLDLDVISGDSSDIPAPKGFTVIRQDLNQSVGGKYIYLCYRADDATAPPYVDDITFVVGDSPAIAAPAGYKRIDVDLNQGAGGKFIYLCFHRGDGPAIETPLRFLVTDEELPAILPGQYTLIPQDLNQGAGGKYIYLGTRRFSNNWMQRISSHIEDRPLNRIAIPGTHDSATYSLDTSSEYAPDDNLNLSSYGFAGELMKSVYLQYAVTQNYTIAQQLEAGIRYLDIRVATHGDNDQDIRITHGLWGTTIEDVVGQINAFVQANTQEIVIVGVKYNEKGILTSRSKYWLMKKLRALGDVLAPPSFGAAVTPGRMLAEGKRVIVLLDAWIHDDDQVSVDDRRLFWRDCDHVAPSDASETMDLGKLKGGLETTIDKTPSRPALFQRLGACLTPDGAYIRTKEFSSHKGSILGNCANPATVELVRWLRGEWSSRTVNIFCTDYFQLAQTVDTAILRNMRPRTFSLHTRLNDFVIDVPGGKAAAGTKLILYPQGLPQSTNQQWILDVDGHIRCAMDPSLVLDITDGSRQPGTPVQLWPASATPAANQLWTFDEAGYIRSRLDPSLVLDVQGDNTSPCTPLIVYTQKTPAAPNQLFRKVEV